MSDVKNEINANPVSLKDLVQYSKGAIVSKSILDEDAGSATIFAFDAGQGLSEHSAPYNAIVQILEGEGAFTVAGKSFSALAGTIFLMPAGKPHSVSAKQSFKMYLVMIQG